MKKLILIFLTYGLSIISIVGQTNYPDESRNAYKLVLPINDSTSYSTDIKSSAYFNGPNVLQIYPGEKVLIEAEFTNGKAVSMKVVKDNKHPNKTIEVFFYQNVENKKHKGMMLSIKNPFNTTLKYEAKIFLMKENKWTSTNVYPVKTNLISYETWPDLIVTIALDEWHLLKD